MTDGPILLPLGAAEHAFTEATVAAARMESFAESYHGTIIEAEASLDGIESLSPFARDKLLAKARREAHDSVDKREDFGKLLRETEALRGRIARAAEYYGDDLRMAELATVDDPRRAQYGATVKGAGHAALRTLADKARAEGNLPLAVAIAQEVGPMERKDRPFDPAQLIRSVGLPEDFRRGRDQFKSALLTLDRYASAREEIRPTRQALPGSSLRKIEAGLRTREARDDAKERAKLAAAMPRPRR